MNGYQSIEASKPHKIEKDRTNFPLKLLAFIAIILFGTFISAELILNLIYRNEAKKSQENVAEFRSIEVKSALNVLRPPIGGRLSCSARMIVPSTTSPVDVNQVRPADIKYIAAMGDSYTTGFTSCTEMTGDVGEMRNYVSNSFVMGGDGQLETHLTLANVLRRLNPSLVGFSTGKGLAEPETQLNVAITGAWVDDMQRQARELIRRFRQYSARSLIEEWKLITIYIGTRDISGFCMQQGETSKLEYKNNLTEAITILQHALPKSIISIIGVANLDFMFRAVAIVKGDPIPCKLIDFNMLAQRRIEEYREAIVEIVSEFRSNSRQDQVVIAQHIFDSLYEPLRNINGSFNTDFYAVDTFHLSNYGNSLVAKQLWNQLIAPDNRKITTNNMLTDESSDLACPEIRCPFIRTPANSLHCIMSDENTIAGII